MCSSVTVLESFVSRFGFESINLHWEGPVDEVRRLVVDVLHLDDDPLVVSI